VLGKAAEAEPAGRDGDPCGAVGANADRGVAPPIAGSSDDDDADAATACPAEYGDAAADARGMALRISCAARAPALSVLARSLRLDRNAWLPRSPAPTPAPTPAPIPAPVLLALRI